MRVIHIFQKYQYYLDQLTPYSSIRWGIAIAFIILFLWRIIELQVWHFYWSLHFLDCYIFDDSCILTFCIFQGFYIVTYALGIYYLNLFLAFLTPKIDPALDFESEGEKRLSYSFLKECLLRIISLTDVWYCIIVSLNLLSTVFQASQLWCIENMKKIRCFQLS